MKTKTGLDVFLDSIPRGIRNKKIGVLCHAASITSSYRHILDALMECKTITLGAIFGPQHGLFGQTQDNMIEWEGGFAHPRYGVSVYSLYGQTRKPTPKMLKGLDAFLVDLQDVGARPYTYIWTVKLCMEACLERQIPVWVLDRPNPIAAVPFDGPMLNKELFTFVGGAEFPLCHRMTMGEMALFLKKEYFPSLELKVVWMNRWCRDSLFTETGLPWVLPSPNIPTLQSALVYPGMVLLEATNVSEGRGSCIPFELCGAPYIVTEPFIRNLCNRELPGCVFRQHSFIPTFNKWKGNYCNGVQVHVTDPRSYQPVFTTASIIEAIIQTLDTDEFAFKEPPYEYEYSMLPFDILAGDVTLRKYLLEGRSVDELRKKWHDDRSGFNKKFEAIAHYPEKSV